MNLWEYIILACITGMISFVTIVFSILYKHKWNHPKIKGILRILKYDNKLNFDTDKLSQAIKISLAKEKNSFTITKGHLEKSIRLNSSEVIKIIIGKLEDSGEMISAPTIVETHDLYIYAYVMGPNCKIPKRINGYDICFKKISTK